MTLDTEVQTPLTLKHRLTWDIFPYADVPHAYDVLGLVHPSPDVASREEHASRERLDRVAPLVPQIVFFAGISADILSKAMLEEQDSLTESEKDLIKHMIFKASIGSSIAVVANMLDLNLLTEK